MKPLVLGDETETWLLVRELAAIAREQLATAQEAECVAIAYRLARTVRLELAVCEGREPVACRPVQDVIELGLADRGVRP